MIKTLFEENTMTKFVVGKKYTVVVGETGYFDKGSVVELVALDGVQTHKYKLIEGINNSSFYRSHGYDFLEDDQVIPYEEHAEKKQDNVKFYYVRKDNENQFGGGITIAYFQDGDILRYGVAYCSKKDEFNKRIGRKVALEMLDNPETSSMINLKQYKRIYPMFDISAENIIDHLFPKYVSNEELQEELDSLA
jgi:hypothetical protein